jgi:hypothetical protein
MQQAPVTQQTTDTGERLVCAVLAAQVEAIRDRVDTGATVDLLWRTADLLTRLSGLVVELSRRYPVPDPGLADRCAPAVTQENELRRSLDAVAFLHAQDQDLARQMADCVVIALKRLASHGAPFAVRLSAGDLAALYVCDDQREVHDVVTRQFGIDSPEQVPAISTSGESAP